MNNKKIRLAILKELDKGNKQFSNEDFDMTSDEFLNILEFLKGEGLINSFNYYMDSTFDFEQTYVTLKGEEYLSNNSPIMKTYNGLKELKSWLGL